jgi:hypothetical protein
VEHGDPIPSRRIGVGRDLNRRPNPLQDRDIGGAAELERTSCPFNRHAAKGAAEAFAFGPGKLQTGGEDLDGVVALKSYERGCFAKTLREAPGDSRAEVTQAGRKVTKIRHADPVAPKELRPLRELGTAGRIADEQVIEPAV